MECRSGATRNRQTKLLKVGVTSTAFLIPIILAAAYLNMGQSSCGGGTPPPPDFVVSKSSDGVAADNWCYGGPASAQGNHIAFSSNADNLDPAAGPATGMQIFVHNIVTQDTTWVNLASLGHSNSQGAADPVLSESGQYIAFWERLGYSTKSVIFRDLNAQPPTFETLFSSSSAATWVSDTTMSGDGRYVGFSTNEPFPSGGDTNDESDVFIKDRQTGSLTRASIGPGSVQYTESANSPRLSRDGVWIAFQLRTLAEEQNEIVVQRVDGTGPIFRFDGRKPSISDDGSLVAYEVRSGPYDNYTVFVFDRIAGTHEQASINYVGQPSYSRCENPVISGDGRYVAFNCLQTMIYATGSGYSDQIYVRDLVDQTTKMASVNPDSEPANHMFSTYTKALSMPANGNALILWSDADNLGDVPGGFPQVYRVPISYWWDGGGGGGGGGCAQNDATCDGVDNDCDGQTDEDFVSQATSCGIGACFATGVTDCQGGVTVDTCVPSAGAPNDPSCDGIDDDCDGPFDEDYVTLPSSCGFGPCAATGTATCVAGQILDSCTPGVPPATDDSLCDGVDNDCDGQIDEDCIICIPSTCQEYNVNCGTVDDGCGGSLNCGSCQSPETCGGGGYSNICGVPLPPDPVDVAPMVDVGTGSMVQSFGFLTEGPTPIQTGVEEGAIEPQRAAIVRGQVLTHAGQSLPGVTIQVKRDASLGQTVSRADGHFDLLINGGGSLTLEFTAFGYLPVQRTVRVPWSGFVELEAVAMTVQSDVATYLGFDANSTDPQIAVSRPVDDGEGQRQVVGYLPAGVQATAEIDGATVPIPDATMRMTEYTIGGAGPKAMPGILPENSLYTFAVDISLETDDGEVGPTTPVTFNKVAYFYLDNFLDFPVGAVVPNGRYDYETSQWVAERDGLVMEVVGIVGGLAEIDATDGDTDPEDQTALDNLGMTDDERREIASRYPVGATFWRMPVDHLSPYDWNHAGFRANPPTPEPPPRDDQVEPEDGDCEKGSIIYCQSRKLAEEVPISGTPYYLRYDSDRSQANIATGRTAIIPLPQSHPTSATEMLVQASVLGREIFNETVPLPLTTTTRTVTWDGLDTYGRPWVGAAELEYRVTYPLEPAYQLALVGSISPQTARSFGVEVCDPGADPCCSRSLIGGGGGGAAVARILPQPGRDATSYTIGYVKHVLLGAAGVDAFGGWSLSHYHAYDAGSGELRRGDGNTVQLAAGALRRPTVAAGLASNGTSSDDVPTTVPVYNDITEPSYVAASPDGTVYFSAARPGRNAYYHQRLWRMDTRGALDEVPNDFCLGVTDLDVDNEGDLHVLCENPRGIYKFIEEAAGQWSTETVVASAGSPWWQDGEPLEGTRFEPTSMAFREDGTLFFAVKNGYNHGASARQRELVEYRSDGTGRIVGVEPGNYIGPGPNNTIVTVTRGLPGGLIRISPNGSTARLVDHSQGYQSDPLYRAKPNDFEWHSTSTHGFGGGATESYWVTGTASGDIFVIRPSHGPPNDCGPSEKLVFQISKGRIRALSLASLPGVGFGAEPCIRPQQLSSGPGGLYALDRHAHQIYSLASGRFATDLTGATEVPSANGSEIYRFSREGRHLSTRDALTGTEIFSFAHDPDGNLSEITDRNGHVTRIDRPDASTVVVTAPAGPGGTAGESTTLQMSSLTGHLEVITDPRQGKWFFEYTNSGLLEKLWDPRANVQGLQSGVPYMFEYEQFKSATATTPEEDARWLLKKDTDPVGGSQTLVLNHTREQTPIYGTWCDGSSYVRGYTIGESTSEVTKTTALGRQVRYTTTTSTDSPVSTTRTEPTGWYVTTTNRDGAASSTSQWPGGTSSSTLTAHPMLAPFVHVPKSSSVSYDAVAGHAALKLDTTHDLQSTFTPSLAGFPVPDTETLTTTLTPTGVGGSLRVYTRQYDRQTRTVTVTSPENRSYSYTLDNGYRIETISIPGQVDTILDYFLEDTGDDGYPHTIKRQKGPELRSMTLGYDTRGYVNSVKNKVSDTKTDEVTMVNDEMGFATQTEVPGVLTIGTSPDIAGALASVTPDGNVHQLSHTPIGQLYQYASPAGSLSTDGSCPLGTKCWRYTQDRELDEIVMPDGTKIDYTYKPNGKLESVVNAPGNLTTSFTYDGFGRRDTATSPSGGTMSFGWQSTLPIRTTWGGSHTVRDGSNIVWVGTLDGTVERFYNDFREISQQQITGGASLQLVRDHDGLLTRVDGVGSLALKLNRSSVDGHVENTVLNRVTTVHGLDVSIATPGFGDLLATSACLNVTEDESCDMSTAELYDASYTYDDRGRISTWTESVQGSLPVTRRFGYDDAGRLITVEDVTNGGVPLEEYDYDGNGNRTRARSEYLGSTAPTLDTSLLDGTLGCGGVASDDEDRLCKYDGHDYDYNSRGQRLSRTDGVVTWQYFYDGLGRLMRATDAAVDVRYIHDALGRRIGKIRDGALVNGWLYQDGLNPVAQLDSNGEIEATFVYGARAHVPDAMVMGDGTVYRFITDHLGSVRLVVDVDAGIVVQRMDYDAFGRVLNDTNRGFQPFGFAGGFYDDDTQLLRFGARDYDAHSGRWTAKDPLLFGGRDPNLYRYVNGDPVNYIDPSGLSPLSPCAKEQLEPFFPDLDLDTVDIQLDVPSWVALEGADAFTLDNTIYVDPSRLSYDPQGLGLLAHELVHVRQYRDAGGIPQFGQQYVLDYLLNRLDGLSHEDAYRNISFEIDAYDIGKEVEERLEQEFGNKSPCDDECE